MELKMTERDRKLLIFLGIFLLVVGVGYFGVLPMRQKAIDLKKNATALETARIETEDHLMMLPAVRDLNASLHDRMAEESAAFYPSMDAKDVDKLLTELVLSNGLEARNLSIVNHMVYDVAAYSHSQLDVTPYVYTGEAPAPANESLENDELLTGETGTDNSLIVSSEAPAIDPRCVWVYSVTLDIRGEGDKLQAFIDLLSDDKKYPAIDIVSYAWGTSETTRVENNQIVISSENSLALSLQVFTCNYTGDQ